MTSSESVSALFCIDPNPSPKVLKEGDRFAVSSTDSHGEVAVTTGLLVRAFA
jgi:hypothetical protein